MRRVLYVFFGMFFIGGFDFVLADKIDSDILIKNQWECEMTHEDKEIGSVIKIQTIDKYIRNNTTNSIGTIKIKFPQIEDEIIYSMSSISSWELDSEYMISTLQTIKIKNISHPEFDEFLNMEELFPENLSTSAKIVKLDNEELILQEEATDMKVFCRATKK